MKLTVLQETRAIRTGLADNSGLVNAWATDFLEL